MIKPSDDCIYFFVVVCGLLILIGLFALTFGVLVIKTGAVSETKLTPGRIQVNSCATSATMPIINWTMKGWMQIVELEQIGNCVLSGKWDKSVYGLYCTGIGTLEGRDWVPDECITIKSNKSKIRYKYP